MSTNDFVEELKTRIMNELLSEAKQMIDDLYKQRIQRATLSAEEAAEYIGVSKMTFYTMVREGQIPSIPVGSINSQRPQIRVRLSTLDGWMAKKEEVSTK